MKTRIRRLLLLAVLTPYTIIAQNLVPNPGFELYSQCPSRYGEIQKADHWYSANGGTPEYFRLDCRYEQGPSFQGQGYAGLILFGDYEKTVEYLAVTLSEPLKPNQLYCAGFSIRAEEAFMYIDRVGLYFSDSNQQVGEWAPLFRNTQVASAEGAPIVPELGWFLIDGQFVAQGGESYLTLGNFYPAEQHLIHLNEFAPSFEPGWNSYYYIDDVFVYELGAGETCRSVQQALIREEMKTALEESVRVVDTLELSQTVYFDFDSDELSLKARSKLDSLVTKLSKLDVLNLELSGHTDRVGTAKYNLYLSERRVQSVENYLIEKGISSEMIDVSWWGKDLYDDQVGPPLDALNRRVLLTLRYARKRK